VPSLVYKGYENETPDWCGGAGTGPIKIKTASGDSCISSTSLYIPVSVTNMKLINNGLIRRAYLVRQHCDYDVRFTLHRHYQFDNQKIAVIDTALHHWSVLTGLTMVLERDDSGNLVFVDTTEVTGKNIIYPFNDASSQLMVTECNGTACMAGSDTVFYRTTKSNIRIKDYPSASSSWSYALSGTSVQYSFYNAFMHELGHILLLDHVIALSQLMHPSITSSQPILSLSASDTSVVAANKNIEDSRAINWPSNILKMRIPAKPVITVSPEGPAVICNGTPITLSSNYPTGNVWSNGATTQTIQVTNPNTYGVYLVDELNCWSMITVTASTLNASFITTHLVCSNQHTGSIITTVAGNHPPYSYQWTGNGINTTTQNLYNLAGGQYSLLLGDNAGCHQNYSVTVTQPEPLQVNFALIPPIGITPEKLLAEVSGGVPPYTYYWSYVLSGLYKCLIDRNYINSSSVPKSYTTVAGCALKLTVTDACGDTIIVYPGAIKKMKIENEAEITIYPNPTTGSFTLSHITDATIHLYSSQGNHIRTFEHVTEGETLDISHLSSGVYVLKIVENEMAVNKKLVLY
jgi:hypothetical protein